MSAQFRVIGFGRRLYFSLVVWMRLRNIAPILRNPIRVILLRCAFAGRPDQPVGTVDRRLREYQRAGDAEAPGGQGFERVSDEKGHFEAGR